MQTFISNNENDTFEFAAQFAKKLKGGSVVAFTGGMGMGKTAFVRGALHGLDNPSRVSSPTFALVNDYGGTPNVYHFDMYRVYDADDLYSTGYFDYLTDNAILFIEWSENITECLPDNTIFVTIEKGAHESQRLITVRTEENA
ncbi:MAG: tRNA (adenosine(37)-N6)-threonylcarbamoyltransferase complex ATPase subunit type 1 TsaE [Oscillospiraceae bacterium]|nr:tRNA (adenosine(37)-N6)-threonylcarbamoyltransferase complex ATPase subunit type 1 TsaE [Oscillospiraceae bacterium]